MANVAQIQTVPERDERSDTLYTVARVLGRGRPDGVAQYCVVLHVTERFGRLDERGAVDAASAWCSANGIEVQS